MSTEERESWRNVRPANAGQRCVFGVWSGNKYMGPCNKRADWIVDYSSFDKAVDRRPHCEAHTRKVINGWTELAKGRRP